MRTHQQKKVQLTELALCNEQAAINSFVTPEDGRRDAAFLLRLDFLTRRIERLERDLAITVQTLCLSVALPLADDTQASGSERSELLRDARSRGLANGNREPREVSADWLSQGFCRQP